MPLAAPYPGVYINDDMSPVLQYWYFYNIPVWKKVPGNPISNIQDIDPFHAVDMDRLLGIDLYVKDGAVLLEYYIVFHLSGFAPKTFGNKISFNIKVPNKRNIPVSVVTNFGSIYTDSDNTVLLHGSENTPIPTENANFVGTAYLSLVPADTLMVSYGVLFRDE